MKEGLKSNQYNICMKEYYIYRHIRLDTGLPFYIGKGSGKGRANSKDRNPYWHNIVNKVGYKVEIMLYNLSEKEAFDKEKYFIRLYGRRDLETGILINMTNGGEGASGYKHTEETKKKLSISHKGKKMSDKSKKKMSESHKGKKLSAETKKKLSNAQKGKDFSDIHRAKLSKKVVNCRGEVFESGLIAAETFGLKSSSAITNNLKGCSKSAGKYSNGDKIVWSFYDIEKIEETE